jgi:hypothetical protein
MVIITTVVTPLALKWSLARGAQVTKQISDNTRDFPEQTTEQAKQGD